MKLLRSWPAVVGTSLLVCLFWACANQGEGERCDKLNNQNGDCESGLVCTPFVTNGATYQLCCPAIPLTSTSSACLAGATSGTGGAAGAAGAPATDGSSDSDAPSSADAGVAE